MKLDYYYYFVLNAEKQKETLGRTKETWSPELFGYFTCDVLEKLSSDDVFSAFGRFSMYEEYVFMFP